MHGTKSLVVIFVVFLGLTGRANAVKATALIFGKPQPSPTTTTAEPPIEVEEEVTDVPLSENSTKPTLTGIPQIDYIWDPNLPRELNGYNLSDYPFYASVPPMEEIDFKCDGLHDGFYASVKHKCQLYHHCLYGVRYDFLCANFTAFDQKTFICHFVSEVDCKNSPKYWHRNDALYQAASSSTTSTTTTTTTPAPLPSASPGSPSSDDELRPRPGFRRRRPPLRRRRPQVDYYYYDDDYDEEFYDERRHRRRKQRPRTRRPDYDYDYDKPGYMSDDDLRYEKRSHNRDRTRIRDDGEDYDYDHRKMERPGGRHRSGESSRFGDGERSGQSDYGDRRASNEDRRVPDNRKTEHNDRRRPDQERRSFNDQRNYQKDRNKAPENDSEESEYRTSQNNRNRNRDRRPVYDEDDRSRRRTDGRPGKKDQDEEVRTPKEEDKSTPRVQSSGALSSLFDRPRTPPKIARPVPLQEKKKYQYSTKTPTTPAPSLDDEYYDEYEDQDKPESILPKHSPHPAREEDDTSQESMSKVKNREPERSAPNQSHSNERDNIRRPFLPKDREETRNRLGNLRDNAESGEVKKSAHNQDKHRPIETIESDEVETNPSKRNFAQRNQQKSTTRKYFRTSTRKNNSDEEEEEYKDQSRGRSRYSTQSRISSSSEKSNSEKRSENSTPRDLYKSSAETELQSKEDHSDDVEKNVSRESPLREARPVVRIVKRPFLPSRGGSPYLPRGLQPVGLAQKQQTTTESTAIDMGSTVSGVRLLEHAAPIVRGTIDLNEDYPQLHQGPRTTQSPQIDSQKSSLDEIYDNEYDVTLNDALNPTLKPLTPIRGYVNVFVPPNKFPGSRFTPSSNYNQNGDSFYSSSDVTSSAVESPANDRTPAGNTRSQEYNDDDYEY